jgi:CheY-like chemotaxis protein
LAQMRTAALPVAIYAPDGLSRRAERDLKRLASRAAVRVAQSPERLFDDAALLLHRPFHALSEPGRATLERLYRGDAALAGRKVLIVDDDIRNIFAMTSVLERCRMSVVSAENGKDAIEMLHRTPGVDILLMDIMMPDMDGYDTMRAIRRIPSFKSLPIVAVTAKAMKGDREKCIEAGAWDYLPKPVDSEQLLSVFRTWLHR